MSAIAIGAPHRPRAPRAAAGRRTRRAPVRLTRRGRAVVMLLLLVVVLAPLASLRAPAEAAGERRGAVAERVTVRPGETLWQIAQRATPGVDPRATVARIRDMNGLESSAVQAGRVLLVPVAG